jgi:secondary thiamine-phosphate synthase enzyme
LFEPGAPAGPSRRYTVLMDAILIDTQHKEQLIDITALVEQRITQACFRDGLCHLWCRHTTAALTVSENADPDVKRDILMALERIVGEDWPYTHAEGNSPAHMKSSLLGCALTLPVAGGKLALGTWQGVLFAEFDGPRIGRKVQVMVIPGGG